jgi:hypothetical protein
VHVAPLHNVEIVSSFDGRHYQAMPRQPKSARLKSRDPGSFKGLLVRMNLDGWRELRILAAERDTTLNALAVEAFNDLLKKRGKQPVVQNPLAIGD